MRTLHETNIDIPPEVGVWIDAAAADPTVRSVILYGSRSTHRYRVDSDWDVALVTAAGQRPCRTVLAGGWELSPKHGFTVLGEDEMLKLKDVYASLPSEVALGVVLRGSNYEVEEAEVARKRTVGADTASARSSYIGLMNELWWHLAREIEHVSECKNSGFTIADPGLGNGSADAAEWAVKLITLALRLPFQTSHSFHELANDLPDDWRERLRELNGNTSKLHAADYGEMPLQEDDIRAACEQSERRLRLTLDVLQDLLSMRSPLTAEDARFLRTRVGASIQRRADVMIEDCSAVVPELTSKFTRVRDGWLNRLARDAAERD